MRARAPATILLFTGLGLTAYTALQCVPMPIAGPRWAPITLDPIATRVEVLKGVAYLLALVLALAAVLHPAFGERKLDGIYDPVAHPHSFERGISKPSKLAGRKVSASASESAMA